MQTRWLIVFSLLCASWANAGAIPKQSWRGLGLQKLDQPAPDFGARDSTILASHRGQWVLLHFWATWCAPCEQELPDLNRLYERWGSHGGIEFLTISIDSDNAKDVPVFVSRLGLQLPVLLATEAHATKRYWIWGVPVTYLIDPDGRLVARALGPRPWDSAAGDALLEGLTADSGSGQGD